MLEKPAVFTRDFLNWLLLSEKDYSSRRLGHQETKCEYIPIIYTHSDDAVACSIHMYHIYE